MIELSVVVPTYRRPALLRRCLESLERQDLDPARFEVVVVDDGSGDRTGRVLADADRRMPNLQSIAQPRNAGPAAARNRGVGASRGDVVLFLDDDVEASPSLVSTHLSLHRSSGDELLGILGLMRWHPRLRITPFMRWLDRSGLQFGYDTWIREGPIDPPFAAFYTCNLSLRKRLVLETGGFDERFPYPAYEDFELAWRLARRGFHLEHRAAALAYHARPIRLRGFAVRMGKVAESAVLLRALQPELPLDELGATDGYAPRKARMLMRLALPVLRLARGEAALQPLYRAEIAAAYVEGRRRGESRLAAHSGSGTPS